MNRFLTYLVTRDFLKSMQKFADYPVAESNFQYRFSRILHLNDVFAQFNFAEIVDSGDTASKAQCVMQWVADNTAYNGGSPLGPALPDKIVEFGIHQKNPINCANRSILFCDILTSLGIFAFPITLRHRPYLFRKKQFSDECHCHVIAQVWLPERKCWAAFDPSFNTFFCDKNGDNVSIAKMVQMIRRHQKFISIDNATKAPTNRGFLCTQLGLLDISVSVGNAFAERHGEENQVHLLPKSYMKLIEQEALAERKYANSLNISLEDIEKTPSWL